MQKFNRRSQMEIMGLAVIVILMILAMLFVVKFLVLPQKTDIRREVTYSTLAGSTLHTLVSTTAANCNKRTFEELLRDCAEHYESRGMISCPPNSCDYAKGQIELILRSSLTNFGVQGYSFNATIEGENIISIGEGDCLYGGKAQTQPYSTSRGSLEIDFMVCE